MNHYSVSFQKTKPRVKNNLFVQIFEFAIHFSIRKSITALKEMKNRIKSIEAGVEDFKGKPLIKYEVIAQSRSLQKMKHFTDELERAVTVVGSLALGVEPKDPLTEDLCIQLSIYSAIAGRKQA